MVRTRSGLLVALVALGLGAGACKKKEESKAGTDPKTTEKPGDVATDMTKPAGAGALVAGDDLSLIPADSEIVVGLNFAQLQQSALWKQFAPKLLEKANKDLAEFKTACGFDPIEAVKSASAGLKMNGDTPAGIVIVHGPDKGKVMACLPKAKEAAVKDGGDVVIDGDVFTIKGNGAGAVTVWTFVNNDTVVGSVGPGASKDNLLAAAKGGSALKTSQTFVEMHSKINTKDSLWMLINGNAPFMAKSAQMGVKAKAVFGSFNVTDGLTLDMRIRVATPDEAAQLVNMAKGQTSNPQVKQMFDKLDVIQDNADVKVSFALSQQKLQQLIGMFAGMMGGMMGGMGGP